MPKHNELNEISDFKVSQKTAKYITLNDQLGNLWLNINKALNEDWGEMKGDEIFQEKFYEPMNRVSDLLFEQMKSSVIETHGSKGNENLI